MGEHESLVENLRSYDSRLCGPSGLVLSAVATKPVRFIGSATTRGLIKRRSAESLNVAHLCVQNDKQRKGLAAAWNLAGAFVMGEFTQQLGVAEHALAVRAMRGRARYRNLRCEVLLPADELRRPPCVIAAGLRVYCAVKRSTEAAKAPKEIFFVHTARSCINRVGNREILFDKDLLLTVPSMNTIGRLPAFLMVYKTMCFRCAITVCRCQASATALTTPE